MIVKKLSRYIPVALIAAVLLVMFAVLPYQAGYRDFKVTIWEEMTTVYAAKGGEWTFGYAVLPVIGILAWIHRKRFLHLEKSPHWSGAVILAFGFLCYYFGYRVNDRHFAYLAGQAFAMGLVVWMLGWRYFRHFFWFWALLAMIWPVTVLIENVSFPMRIAVTHMTSGFLNLIGVETIRNGTDLLSAPTANKEAGEVFSMQVAAACSGLRSLIALFLIGVVVAYSMLKSEWKRAVLVLFVVPFAIFGNFVRMLILLVGVVTLGNETAIGKGEHEPSAYHLGAGFVVYIILLVCLVSVAGLLERNERFSLKKLFGRKKRVVKTVKSEGGAA